MLLVFREDFNAESTLWPENGCRGYKRHLEIGLGVDLVALDSDLGNSRSSA